MRFMMCMDSEKQTSTIYEIVNKKPVKVTTHPLALPKLEKYEPKQAQAQYSPSRSGAVLKAFETADGSKKN